MSREKKTKKRDSVENMVAYTYRDSGQEYLMRQKMVRAIVISIILAIALTVFVALYVSETRRVQETYRAQYDKALINVLEDIHSYQNADGDFELRYRMIVSDMSVACMRNLGSSFFKARAMAPDPVPTSAISMTSLSGK